MQKARHPTLLTPERWARMQDLFERALALEVDARPRFLVEKCGEDVALREQVLALLLASSDGPDDLESRYGQAIADVLQAQELAPGTIIGRYRIERLLGRGGMGAVYLAERADEQFHHVVALKLVARHLLHSGAASRFRSERQILARLNHPNIARLLDGGHTQDGAPYFVMEYVEGERIDHYCAQRQLSISGRLRLVQQLCAAVQYAHQNLIVHRDLKAANIIVSRDGVPKLLDFGIAKLLDADNTAPELTRLRDRVLTPEYASPEQLRGEPVGTASDIYNLGLLLYELLSGVGPYAGRTRSPIDLERIICEGNPPPPSTRAAEVEGSGLVSLKRALQVDLDNIALKAMHVDPTRRYATANALAADIQNYLDGRAVQARPDTFTYRAGKFLWRNAWSTAGVAAAVLLITGITAFYTMRLAAERDRATREMNKAKQVAQFLGGIFQAPDPWRGPGRAVTAVELLERGAADIELRLKNDPPILAELLSEIAHSYQNLADYDRAIRMQRRSLEVQAAAGLARTPEYALTLYELANALRFQGRFAESEQSFKEALSLQRSLLREPNAAIAASLTHLGTLYYEMGRLREALALEREALPMTLAVYGELHAETADRMNNLALVLQAAGELREAESYFRRAIAIHDRALPPKHPDALNTKSNLGALLNVMGHYARAERQMRTILADRRKVLGDGHPRVAYTLTSLGSVLTSLGKFADAEAVLNEALGTLSDKLGESHFRTSNVLRNLGMVALARGDFVRAEELFRRQERIEIAVFGESSDTVHRTRALIATALRRQGRSSEAEPLLVHSYERFIAQGAPVSGQYDRTLVELGGIRLEQGDVGAATELFKKSLDMYVRLGVPDHPDTADALLGLARIARMRSRDEAVALANRAIANLRAELPEGHWRVVQARASLSELAQAERAQTGLAHVELARAGLAQSGSSS